MQQRFDRKRPQGNMEDSICQILRSTWLYHDKPAAGSRKILQFTGARTCTSSETMDEFTNVGSDLSLQTTPDSLSHRELPWYCWWKKSQTTTWDV